MTDTLKQQYHLEPPHGLLNDPNGLAYFNNKYHVFFQWNKFEKDHSYKEWGHFESSDLISWQFKGSAIIPDQSYDKKGVYSGSGLVIDDKLYLFYTGNNKENGQRESKQCLVVSEDGRTFLKQGVILHTPEQFTEHFRDPKVFYSDSEKCYFMLVGAQRKNGKGAIALCSSVDGVNWEYKDILCATEQYEMIECPDMFQLNNTDVLLYNPQKRDNTLDTSLYSFSAYKIGSFNDLDNDFSLLDYGFDFYAPQTFSDENGRRILFAWMSRMEEEQEKIFASDTPYIHCLTIPRELFIKNNILYQRPIKELYQLLGNDIPLILESETIKKFKPKEHTFYLHIKDNNCMQNIYISFHQGQTIFEYSENEVKFTRKNWVTNEPEFKTCNLKSLSEIEIWADNSSMEIFLNNGEKVFSSRIFALNTEENIILKGFSEETIIETKEIISKL